MSNNTNTTYNLTLTLTNGISSPVEVVIDNASNIWVSNIGNNFIDKFSSLGQLQQSIYTGDGSYPISIAVDLNGNLWVANLSGNNVEEFSSTGNLLQTLSIGVNYPSSVAIDGIGNAWITNYGNNTLEEFSSSGLLLQTVATGSNSTPWILAIDSHNDVFVGSFGSNGNSDSVQEFSSSGVLLQTLSNGISDPASLAVDSSGNIYIANSAINTVEKFSANGTLLQTISTGDGSSPSSVAVDLSGNIWVACQSNNTVQEFSANGALLQTIGTGDGSSPSSIAVDSTGHVWVANENINTVQEYMVSPILSGAAYSAATGQLTLTGNNLTALAAEYVISDFSITGDGGKTFQLSHGNVIVGTPTSTAVTLQLCPGDQLAIDALLNKNGTVANDDTSYKLSAATGWDAGAAASGSLPVTVSNAVTPTFSGLVYNAALGVFSVTGSQLVGGVNLSDWSMLNGQFHFNSTDTVSYLTSTGFAVTLSAQDRVSLNTLLLNGTHVSLAAQAGWDGDSGAAVSAQAVLVNPVVNAVTYNAANGQLTLTGNYMASSGYVMPDISLQGDGGVICTLSNSSYVLGTPTNTSVTIQLSAATQLAVDGVLNKNGTAANDGSSYNLAASAGWGLGSWQPGATFISTEAVTVSNVSTPTLSSVSYNESTGVLNFIGSHLTNGINLGGLSLLNGQFALNSTDSISGLNTAGFSINLSTQDQASLNALLANGPSASLATSAGWDSDSGTAQSALSVLVNPVINAAAYNAANGQLTLTGHYLTAAGIQQFPALSLTGDGGVSYALGLSSQIIGIPTSSNLTIQLSAGAQVAFDGLLNKNGTVANDGTAYSLSNTAGWHSGATAIGSAAITVSNAMTPTLSGLVYNAALGVFSVTGSQLVGGVNLSDWSMLNGQFHFSSSDTVSYLSSTGFAVTLSAQDQASLNTLLLNGTHVSLAAQAGWDGDSGAAVSAQAVLVNPVVNSVTYNAANGQLTLTGNYMASPGYVIPDLALKGDGGHVCGFSNSSHVLGTPNNTSVTIQLSAATQLAVDGVLNHNGTQANDGTAYNFSASAGWGLGSYQPGCTAISTEAVTVINATAPTLSAGSYNESTGVLNFIGSQLANGINLSDLSLLNGQFTLNSTDSVSSLNATGFAVSLSVHDQTSLDALLLNSTTTSLTAQAGWDSDSGAAITHGVTVQIIGVSH